MVIIENQYILKSNYVNKLWQIKILIVNVLYEIKPYMYTLTNTKDNNLLYNVRMSNDLALWWNNNRLFIDNNVLNIEMTWVTWKSEYSRNMQ